MSQALNNEPDDQFQQMFGIFLNNCMEHKDPYIVLIDTCFSCFDVIAIYVDMENMVLAFNLQGGGDIRRSSSGNADKNEFNHHKD